MNCASNGAKIIFLGHRTAVWRSHDVERKIVLVRSSQRRANRTSFRSTSRDRQTAVRRPRSINFAPFNAQFISDVLATLFIWSKAECGSLCSWSYRWDMEKSWPEFLCLRESVFQQKRSSYRACGLWEVSLTFRHNPTLLTFYISHVKLLIQILSK